MARGIQVDYKEYCGHDAVSPRFSGDLRSQKTIRTYDISRWADTEIAIVQALGYPELDSGDGKLKRYLPHQDPMWPNLVATSYDGKGIGKPSTQDYSGRPTNIYTGNPGARIEFTFTKPLYHLIEDAGLASLDTANYNSLGPRWAPEIDRYVEYEEIPQGSYITPPATSGLLAWAPGQTGSKRGIAYGIDQSSGESNAVFPQQVPIIFAEANIVLRWHQVPDEGLPIDRIYDCLGCINQTDFGSYNDYLLSFAPWSMLFLGATFQRIVMPALYDGGLSYNELGWIIEYLFKFSGQVSSVGSGGGGAKLHNYFYDFKNEPAADFFQVTKKPLGGTAPYFTPGGSDATPALTNGKLVYGLANLNKLFYVQTQTFG